MRRQVHLIIVALLVSTAIVTIGLHFRQTPERSATDAYLPMRPLFPDEAAALLVAEDEREADAYSRTVIIEADSEYIVLLTRDYPIRVPSSTTSTPESHGHVSIAGRSFHLTSNSWENYVSRYRVPRVPTERWMGRSLAPAPEAELSRSRFNEDRISFSSDRIWIYFLTEVLFLACLIVGVALVLGKLSWLLWLPCLMAMQVLVLLFVCAYSPAFFDADWFHQRIVIERIALADLSLIGLAHPYSLFAATLSLVVYLLRKLGATLATRNMLPTRTYWVLAFGIGAGSVSVLLISQYLAFKSMARRSGALLTKTITVLEETNLDRLIAHVTPQAGAPQENLLKENRLTADGLETITKILGVRSSSDPDLRILIPVEGKYLFLWRNNRFAYADIRGLKSSSSSIIDYEFIQRVVHTGRGARTSFPAYLRNWMEQRTTQFIEAVPVKERDAIAAFVIVGG